MLLVGVLLIFLPGPAFIVVPAGLAILATEFGWAKELLGKVKKKFMTRANQTAKGAKTAPPAVTNRESPMPDNDLDLNVVNLTETKSHRAPTSESVQRPAYRKLQTTKWPTAIRLGALGGLLVAAMIVWRMGFKNRSGVSSAPMTKDGS